MPIGTGDFLALLATVTVVDYYVAHALDISVSTTRRQILLAVSGESRYPEVFEIPGFGVALAVASFAGMTIDLCNEL